MSRSVVLGLVLSLTSFSGASAQAAYLKLRGSVARSIVEVLRSSGKAEFLPGLAPDGDTLIFNTITVTHLKHGPLVELDLDPVRKSINGNPGINVDLEGNTIMISGGAAEDLILLSPPGQSDDDRISCSPSKLFSAVCILRL